MNDTNNKTPGGLSRSEVLNIIEILERRYPEIEGDLRWNKEPWKLLVMGILSAQCTDKRVNIISRELFSICSAPAEVAALPIEQLENVIRSCGLYKTKAKNIKESCRILDTEYDGGVPDNMDDLLKLPGVGRKIANLILGDVFGLPAVVADTHCIRLSARIGLTAPGEKNPLRTERALSVSIPPEKQSSFCHRFVWFGRDVCTARSPDCGSCELAKICRYVREQNTAVRE